MTASPYAGSRFQLTVDGKFPGYVYKFSGGDATAEVVESKLGALNVVKKNIGTIKYDELSFEMAVSMGKVMLDWIQQSWNGSYIKKDIEVAIADANGNIQMTKTLTGCLITSVKFSACDASNKENGKMTIKVKPDMSRITVGGGGKVKGDLGKSLAKNWLCSNFRWEVAGCDTKETLKVDELEFTQKVADVACGEQREYINVPATVTWPNIKWTVQAHSGAKTHYDWYKQMVIEGLNDPDANERTAALHFLSPDRKKELGSINFFNVGITKFKYSDPEAGKEKAQTVEMEAYCEKMELKVDAVDM